MAIENENLRGAMKGVQYDRTIKLLKKSLREAQTFEAALATALNITVEAVRAVSGTFWVYDRYRDGRIYPKSVYGGGSLGNMSLLLGEGIAGTVIEKGEADIIPDCQQDPRWAGKVDARTGFVTKSMICVPLGYSDEIFGCIQMINKIDTLPFDEADLDFTLALAETITDLFESRGVLDEYRTGASHEAQGNKGISFMQIMGADSLQDMEYQLRKISEFSMMGAANQEQVLTLARQMYTYFAGKDMKKNRTAVGGFTTFLSRRR